MESRNSQGSSSLCLQSPVGTRPQRGLQLSVTFEPLTGPSTCCFPGRSSPSSEKDAAGGFRIRNFRPQLWEVHTGLCFAPGDRARAEAQSPPLNLTLLGRDRLQSVETRCPAGSLHPAVCGFQAEGH